MEPAHMSTPASTLTLDRNNHRLVLTYFPGTVCASVWLHEHWIPSRSAAVMHAFCDQEDLRITPADEPTPDGHDQMHIGRTTLPLSATEARAVESWLHAHRAQPETGA